MPAHAHQVSKAARNFLARFRRGTKGINALSVGFYPMDPCEGCNGGGVDADGDTCYDCDGTGRTCKCPQCPTRASDDEGDEGSFSWSDCDTCGSHLGGDRHAAHGLVSPKKYARRTELIHLDVCTDCLFFIANGDLPGGD